MASPDRKPGSDLGRPAIDWEEAFAYFASLPKEHRSYGAVAAEFGVSPRTVEKHGRADEWRQRVRGIEAQAAARVDERLGRAWADRIEDVERLVDASFVTYAQQLRSGNVRITTSEFVGLVKLLLQLRGEPSERIEVMVEERVPAPPSPQRMLEVVRALHQSGAFAALEALEGEAEEITAGEISAGGDRELDP